MQILAKVVFMTPLCGWVKTFGQNCSDACVTLSEVRMKTLGCLSSW